MAAFGRGPMPRERRGPVRRRRRVGREARRGSDPEARDLSVAEGRKTRAREPAALHGVTLATKWRRPVRRRRRVGRASGGRWVFHGRGLPAAWPPCPQPRTAPTHVGPAPGEPGRCGGRLLTLGPWAAPGRPVGCPPAGRACRASPTDDVLARLAQSLAAR